MTREGPKENSRIEFYTDLLLLVGMTAFLMIYFDVRYLFIDTVVTGGDTASWYGVADHLMKVLLPSGRLTGWDMGNFAGYPSFTFYFLPPFLLAVVPSALLGIPLTIALKWAIMSGIFLLPPAAYWGLRNMEYRFPVPIMGAAGAMLLMFNESYTMFGANTLSTFAGEFCYMFAFALFIYFIGSFYRGYKTQKRVLFNGILLGLIGLSHLFVFIPALFLLVYAFFDGGRVRYLLGVGLNAFAIMAFWILPLLVFRHPYTTPVYMIWQEFVNWRYFTAGMVIIIISLTPRMALGVVGRGEDITAAWGWGFTAFCAGGLIAITYLAAQYLVLGTDIWTTGLNLPDLSASPLGEALAGKLQPLILPISVLSGLVTAAIGVRARRKGYLAFAAFSRIIGSLGLLLIGLFFVLALHLVIAKSVGLVPSRAFLSRRSFWSGFYAILFLISGGVLISSHRFKNLFEKTARREAQNASRFMIWPALVFGCMVAYFSAHFLQVPDIRFLPPLIYALGFIVWAETLGLFVIEKRTAVRVAAAITSAYLVIVLIIFGAERSDSWFRSNNRGYQMTAGFQDFSRVNQYLKTAYLQKGLNPLNAPRVAYEKCDLYGPYGGDRAFESLPFFSGRQTLEGIHFAGSLASRSIAYLQTEFSRDIKTPKPQIFSKINSNALPAHFDLYNISQLIVMTSTVKKALSSSPRFEKEAVFGDISLYRYLGNNQRYVDVPKIRPVLYTGKNWTDDFYRWLQDPDRVDVLLVPDRYVSDANDRALFSGKTDSIADLKAFRKNRLDRKKLKIDSHLDHLKIRFTTNKIGLPHLVKVSYFPNWRVKGARGVYPVSPHFIMVIPREKEVVLTYARSNWELLGLVITAGWFVFVLGATVYRYVFLTRKGRNRANRNKIWVGLERAWEVFEDRLARYRTLILWLVLMTGLGLILAGAAMRNRPERIYTAGFQAYKKGVRLLQAGENPEAKIYFRRAVSILEPLVDERASRDHRDVINSLLIAAMCDEKRTEYRSAEERYRILIREYPRSRYVAEGYVKLARIYKWQALPLWQQGLNVYRRGEKEKGALILRQSLALMEKSVAHYRRASQKDPFSVWVRYGRDDLKKEKGFLKNALKELTALKPDIELKDRLEKLVEAAKLISG